MAKKNFVFLILLILINVCYFGFLFTTNILNKEVNEYPIITFDNEEIHVSVKASEQTLLKGVSASDTEDGDITGNVFIYSIEPFNFDKERLITYGVFDSNNQMTTATRTMKYTDYESPKFSSKTPLFNMMASMNGSEKNEMKATSCIDGDISNRISRTQTEKDGKVYYHYSVIDSTGTFEELTVSYDISLKELMTNVTIELSDYIIYVKKGTELDFKNFISDVKTSIGYQPNLIEEIGIETNYDATTPGTYEVSYKINRSNGDYGTVKMFVIVEE